MRNMWKILLALAALQLISWLLPSVPEFKGIPNYLPLHTFLESVSIVASMMVFAAGWNSNSRNLSGNIVLLACASFAVGLLDFSHTISYGGMPDFISPNDAQKHLNFWLSARFFECIALLVVAVRPSQQIVSLTTRNQIFAALVVMVLAINWVVIFHQGWLPDTFIPGQGLTPFKKNVEYLIIVLNVVTAVILWSKMRKPQNLNVVLLFGAACTLAMSEFYFTLYTTMTGSYNVLGHIYKVIAYLFIYRAIVVEVIEEPYSLLEREKAKFSNIFDSVNDGIELISMDGRIVDMNRIGYEQIGRTRQEVVGKPIAHFITPEFASGVQERFELTREQGHFTFESARIRKDGSVIPVEVSSRIVEVDGQQLFLGTCRDISERVENQSKIVELNRDFIAFLENTTDFIYFKDENSRIRFCSQTLANITGHASWRDMVGKHDFDIFPKDTAQIYYEEELPIFSEGKPLLNKEDPYYDKAGNKGWVSTSKWPLFNQDNLVVGLFGISRDITEHKRMEEQVRELAFYDTLTHLPNRRLLFDRLLQSMSASKRNKCYGALLFLDLDNFKALNDAHGHATGDLLLVEAANRIKKCVREMDTVARLGGDEFVVLLNELDVDNAAATSLAKLIAEKILATLSAPYSLMIARDDRSETTVEHRCTASIGVVMFIDHNNQDEIIKRADAAMYLAKEEGRNSIRFYSENHE